jgi:hypothetical protein
MGGVKLYQEVYQLKVVVFVNSRMLSESIVSSDRRMDRISSVRMDCLSRTVGVKAVDE